MIRLICLAPIVLLVGLLAGCNSPQPPEVVAVPSSPTSGSPSATATSQHVVPTAVTTPDSRVEPLPSPSPTPLLSGQSFFVFDCHDPSFRSVRLDTFRDVWAYSDPLRDYDALTTRGSFEVTAAEADAIESAFGHRYPGAFGSLLEVCANLHLQPIDVRAIDDESQKLIVAALQICPDQPAAADAMNAIAAANKAEAERTSGTRFGWGIKRVGTDIQAGLYVSEGAITGCYWEKLDASGAIIDNAFISEALRIEVWIDPADYSFSSKGCGEWVLQL